MAGLPAYAGNPPPYYQHQLNSYVDLCRELALNEVVICTGNLAYTIEFPNHAAGSSEYLEKLQTFCERENTEVPLFGALGLHNNPITAAPSQPFTPCGIELPTYLHIGKIASSWTRGIRNTMSRKRYSITQDQKRLKERGSGTGRRAWVKDFRMVMAYPFE
jgi:hypothetical protein